jgi:hypothetical protein
MLNEKTAGKKLTLQQQHALRARHWHWFQAIEKRGPVEPVAYRIDRIHGQMVVVKIYPGPCPDDYEKDHMQTWILTRRAREERMRKSSVPFGASIFTKCL